MDLLKQFVEYLALGKNRASKATIKNYRSDISQFITWFENEFNKPFNPKAIMPQLIEVYTKYKNLSPRSLERHLSSLKKFFHFLKIQEVISTNPLLTIKTSLKNPSLSLDKWHLDQFKNYLYVYNLASLTIKNYVIDMKQFLAWLEKVTGINHAWDLREKNLLEKINPMVINEYKERLLQKFSPKTINRKLSSLRKYLVWAQEQGLIKTELQDLQIRNESLKTRTYQPLGDLHIRHSGVPLKRSIESRELKERDPMVSLRDDLTTLTPTRYFRFPLLLLQKITNGIIFIFDSLFIFPLAKTIDQIKYLAWKTKGKPIFKQISNKQLGKQSLTHELVLGLKIENYPKAMYDPLSISTAYFPLHKKVWHHLKYSRPKWYKKYHSYPIIHYIHFAILIISMSAIGFMLYNHFIFKPDKIGVLSALDSYEPRILAFKGRLTDSLDNPITTSNTTIRMGLYNDQTATGAALLWQEVVSVNPNKDGIFQTTLGKNLMLPQNIFIQNASLWVGISIGQTAELTPRQELALVSTSANAQTLQSLSPITDPDAGTRNVILALDSSGNLSIGGSATPVFQATDGQFTLTGKVLLLTTINGSSSDVTINPDGLGKIDLEKPLQNTSKNNNIASAIGALEIDDLVAILATSSGQSAFTINQDSTGPIISASTSGVAKFTVDNIGNIISGAGSNWQPSFDSPNALNIADASGIPFVTLNTLTSSLGIGTIIPEATLDLIGTFRASGNLTLSQFTSNGGVIYASKSGVLLQTGTGTSTQCLLGGTTPKFDTCPSSLGSQTASISGNIVLDSAGSIQTTKLQTLTIGGVTTGGIALSPSSVSPSLFAATSGNIGIGTAIPLFKLDIQDSQTATAAAQIFNANTGIDADGLIVKLGNTSTTAVANSNHFISFETSGIGIVGSVRGDGAKGLDFRTSGIADFAEYLKKDKTETIEYGSLICIDNKGLVTACDQTNTKMIGVASRHGGFTGGEDLGENSIRVGFVGQIYTKVSTMSGIIKPGDPLTYSSIPGVAVKATKAGPTIGRALQGFSSENVGKILVSVNLSWYDPYLYLTNTGDLNITEKAQNRSPPDIQTVGQSDTLIYPTPSGVRSFLTKSDLVLSFPKFSLVSAFGKTIDRIGAFAELITANLQAGFIKAEEISVGRTIISPIAKINQIQTNLISPLASDSLRIHLGGVSLDFARDRLSTSEVSTESGKLIVENAKGVAVATIDNQGNASFAGTLKSTKLDSYDASISGTLRAKKIIIDSIEGLNTSVSTLAAQYTKISQKTQKVGTSDNQSLGLSDPPAGGLISPIPSLAPSLTSGSGQLGLTNNLNALTGLFTQSLMAFGTTSLYDASIVGQLSLGGRMFLNSNSINVLGSDLEIQSLRQGGVSFFSDLVRIDENGNLKLGGNAEFAKDATVKGKLWANIISPIPDADLVISLGSTNSTINHNSSFIIQNSSGSSVLSVNQRGDLKALGSGTFSQLNLGLAKPALAISEGELVATGSAGVAGINKDRTEVTLKNKLVTDKSLIYLTPIGTPSAQTLFLIRQGVEAFTVGTQNQAASPLPFNWLIVN